MFGKAEIYMAEERVTEATEQLYQLGYVEGRTYDVLYGAGHQIIGIRCYLVVVAQIVLAHAG